MPAVLIRILTWLMTSLAGQVLFSLGLGVISFSMLDGLINWIINHVLSDLNNTNNNIKIAMSLLQFDYGISVILSALVIKSTIMASQVALARK